MPRQPIGERAMTDAERQRRRRERLLHAAAGDNKQRERLRQAAQAAKRRYDTLQKAVGGETAASAELIEARQEIAALRKQLAAARPQAVPDGTALDWQAHGDKHTARRGAWTYFIRRDSGRRFIVAINSGHSLPDKLVEMPSLELAKAHCAEHATAHPVSDAAEIARLRRRVAELEAKPPKATKPQLDPESAAAIEIKGLKTKIRNFQNKFNHVKAGGNFVPFAVNALLAKALSEIPPSTAADRERALKALNAWKADTKPAEQRKAR